MPVPAKLSTRCFAHHAALHLNQGLARAAVVCALAVLPLSAAAQTTKPTTEQLLRATQTIVASLQLSGKASPASPPAAASAGAQVFTSGVTLVTSEEEVKQRVRVADFVQFIQTVEAKAHPILATNRTGALVLLQFHCTPAQLELKIASKGEAQDAVLLSLYEALHTLAPLRTEGQVVFHVEMGILP
jgi:hypothetical protein